MTWRNEKFRMIHRAFIISYHMGKFRRISFVFFLFFCANKIRISHTTVPSLGLMCRWVAWNALLPLISVARTGTNDIAHVCLYHLLTSNFLCMWMQYTNTYWKSYNTFPSLYRNKFYIMSAQADCSQMDMIERERFRSLNTPMRLIVTHIEKRLSIQLREYRCCLFLSFQQLIARNMMPSTFSVLSTILYIELLFSRRDIIYKQIWMTEWMENESNLNDILMSPDDI